MFKARPRKPVDFDIGEVLYFKAIKIMGLCVSVRSGDIFINTQGPYKVGQRVKVMPEYVAYRCVSSQALALELIQNKVDFSFVQGHLRVLGHNTNINDGDYVIFTECGVRVLGPEEFDSEFHDTE